MKTKKESKPVGHTPEPWIVEDERPSDTADANACLIAAAPDLLEAAKYVLLVDRALGGPSKLERDTAIAKLRAAIAKATEGR